MTTWSVMFEAAADDDDPEVSVDQLWPLIDALAGHSLAVGGGGRRYDAQFDVDGPDVATAIGEALRLWRRAVTTCGLPAWPIIHAAVMTATEQDRTLAEPNMPALVGVSEIAARLGTTRTRAWQVTKKADFPDPLAELAAGPVWAAPTVERFVEQWRRRPGPTPARSSPDVDNAVTRHPSQYDDTGGHRPARPPTTLPPARMSEDRGRPPTVGPASIKYLHQAMEQVLAGQGWLTLEEVAGRIADRRLWRRPSDGQFPAPDQIRRRAAQSNGRHLDRFEISDGRIRLR